MSGSRRLTALLASVVAGTLLLVAGCGSSASTPHSETPTSSTRAAILSAVESGFFSSTGAPPTLRLTALEEVGTGSTEWARATFGATRQAPATTREALTGGHDEGLLREAGGGSWTWLGYLPPGRASCRTTGRSVPGGVARLLGLSPVCASVPTPDVSPLAAPSSGVSNTALSSGDLATLLSIFVSTKNSGPAGQVLTPGAIMVSRTAPPQAALIPTGEWAVVTYTPAAGAPEPLTATQLQDGTGTGFFFKQAGRGWVLRGLAGQPFCNGARSAQVPAAVLAHWGHSC